MSQCVCFTWPEHIIAGRTIPSGTVGILRPAPQLIAALILPEHAQAVDAAKAIGISAAVVEPLWNAMQARTESEAVRVIAARDLPKVCAAHGIDPASLTNVSQHDEVGLLSRNPDGLIRRFRGSWRQLSPSAPTVDMPLARVQRMNEIRVDRKPKLEKSDVDFLRAQEQTDLVMQDKLKTYRQALRDVPQKNQSTINAITTPDALAAWSPTWPVDPA